MGWTHKSKEAFRLNGQNKQTHKKKPRLTTERKTAHDVLATSVRSELLPVLTARPELGQHISSGTQKRSHGGPKPVDPHGVPWLLPALVPAMDKGQSSAEPCWGRGQVPRTPSWSAPPRAAQSGLVHRIRITHVIWHGPSPVTASVSGE